MIPLRQRFRIQHLTDDVIRELDQKGINVEQIVGLEILIDKAQFDPAILKTATQSQLMTARGNFLAAYNKFRHEYETDFERKNQAGRRIEKLKEDLRGQIVFARYKALEEQERRAERKADEAIHRLSHLRALLNEGTLTLD